MPEGPEVKRVQASMEILQDRMIMKATVTSGRYAAPSTTFNASKVRGSVTCPSRAS